MSGEISFMLQLKCSLFRIIPVGYICLADC